MPESATLGTADRCAAARRAGGLPCHARNGQLVGVLERRGLVTGLAQQGREVMVASIMRRDFTTVDAGGMLEAALVTMQTCGCETLPVMRGGSLVGLLTKHNVGEFLAVQSALEAASRARAASRTAGHADAGLSRTHLESEIRIPCGPVRVHRPAAIAIPSCISLRQSRPHSAGAYTHSRPITPSLWRSPCARILDALPMDAHQPPVRAGGRPAVACRAGLRRDAPGHRRGGHRCRGRDPTGRG